MIRYALRCSDCDAEFEAWFASSGAFDVQKERGLLDCPECHGHGVAKQIMSPSVAGTKSRDAGEQIMARFLAAARKHVSENFDYVGPDFASEARAMYYGDAEERAIWGETTPEEARALIEEGVPAAPLPAPMAPTPPLPAKEELN